MPRLRMDGRVCCVRMLSWTTGIRPCERHSAAHSGVRPLRRSGATNPVHVGLKKKKKKKKKKNSSLIPCPLKKIYPPHK
eukprot:NODE_30413_length_419_cov_1.952055.p4 GENE.NODE_30413_length_419_cov_1.952055~~NODE_30413_length_419_cov_1.952055.p4  ORF type:complete len:79 (-),score=29.79 NODE_30413_length_419_cov_1.952055:69-305(-)